MNVCVAVGVGDFVIIDFREPVVGGDRSGVGKNQSADGLGDGGVFFYAPVIDFNIVINGFFEVEDG